MAVLQVARALTLMLVVFHQGCHSQQLQCGVATSNNRIVGGQDAVPDSWPWFAALNISGSFFCGGSLISDRWVLTSARCGKAAEGSNGTQVFLGLHNMSNPGADVVIMSVEEVVCHPYYYRYSSINDNDICLLKLSAPVNFSHRIQPICLSSRNSTFPTGLSSWVIGFGETVGYTPADVLQEVNLPIMGNNQCECYRSFWDITDNMICAGQENGRNGSCLGDAGGPLMIKISTSWVQVGVLSFEYNCGYFQSPGVYTRVSQYEDWIKENVNGSDLGFVTFTSPGFDPDSTFICPTTPPPPNTTYPSFNVTVREDDSVFDGGENLIRFTHVFSLCVVGLSLHVLGGVM